MMKYTHFLLIASCCLSLNVMGQAQYGLVIGINRYYKLVNGQKTLDPENSKLKGCVNDAKAIKALLVSRFGFKPDDVMEIYDFEASETNVRKAIKDLLAKCKPGDVAVFYYSGHGFSFPHIDPGTGTQWAEAICTSDFSATPQQRYNYIQGSELANLFGQFVDKGVTLTSLFDCCHSNSTVRLQKTPADLTGIRKVLDMSAWNQAKEFDANNSYNQTLKQPYNIFSADPDRLIVTFARDTVVSCDAANNASVLSGWLNRHGGSVGRNEELTWTYKELKKFNRDCETRGVQYEFTASDNKGRTETTRADFLITDNTAPTLVSPAQDTTIICCGNNYATAFDSWLSRRGGARAWDACSLTWSNDYTEQKRNDLDKTGSTQVLFTATDGCQVISTKATFTVEELAAIDPNRISDLEVNLMVSLLNALPTIKESLSAPNYSTFAGNEQRFSQLQLLEKQRDALLSANQSSGPVTKTMVEKLQGAQALGELYAQISHFVDLTDPLINYKSNLVAGMLPVSQPPLDFLKPVSDRTDYADFLKEGTTSMAKEIVMVTADPALFPYQPFPFRPPSKIPGSRYLFISATDDVQQGVEKKDEHTEKRGAFTKALINVMRDNPATLNAVAVFEKVQQELTKRFIPHNPSMSIAANRRKSNLFGVDPKKIVPGLSAKCIKELNDSTLVLDKGKLSGLSPGNILRYSSTLQTVDVEIISMTPVDSCLARIKKDPGVISSITSVLSSPVGDEFTLVDPYTRSAPLVKVYIPQMASSVSGQQAVIQSQVAPRAKTDKRFVPYSQKSLSCKKIFLKEKGFTMIANGAETAEYPLAQLAEATQSGSYFLYLPVPAEVAKALEQKCQQDQNIALVKDPLQANLSFYVAYSTDEASDIYAVTDQETTGKFRTNTIHVPPYYYFSAVDPRTHARLTPAQIAENIYQTLLMYAAKYGWLNKFSRK